MTKHTTITAGHPECENIRRMMTEGHKRKYIAAALGLSPRQVSFRAKSMGLSFEGALNPSYEYTMHKRAIVTLTNRGCTRAEIMEVLGLSENVVRSMQKRFDVEAARSRGIVIKEWTPAHQVLWDSNLTLSEIASGLGVHFSALIRAADRAGIPGRKRGKKPKPVKARELTPLERMQQMARNESRAAKEYTGSRA